MLHGESQVGHVRGVEMHPGYHNVKIGTMGFYSGSNSKPFQVGHVREAKMHPGGHVPCDWSPPYRGKKSTHFEQMQRLNG